MKIVQYSPCVKRLIYKGILATLKMRWRLSLADL